MPKIKEVAEGRLEKAAEYYTRNPKETKNFGYRTREKLVTADAKRIKNKADYESIGEVMTPRKKK